MAGERKDLFLIREFKGEGDKTVKRWTRVGVGFVNADSSINLRIDEGMVLQHGLSYQLRDPRPEGDEPAETGVLGGAGSGKAKSTAKK